MRKGTVDQIIGQDVSAMTEVAAAIIENSDGQLLIARRKEEKSQGGLWEFPGGKIEKGETPQACLKRELLEEMGIEIDPYMRYGVNEHVYGTTSIRLTAFKASYVRGSITLCDHDDYRWVTREQLKAYSFTPADIRFVEMLQAEA